MGVISRCALINDSYALCNTKDVCVDGHGRHPQTEEQNAGGGFGSDTVDLRQLGTRVLDRKVSEPIKIEGTVLIEYRGKCCLNARSFLVCQSA